MVFRGIISADVRILPIPEKEIAVKEQIIVTKQKDNKILFKHITSFIYNPMKKAIENICYINNIFLRNQIKALNHQVREDCGHSPV